VVVVARRYRSLFDEKAIQPNPGPDDSMLLVQRVEVIPVRWVKYGNLKDGVEREV
jgi:hypothetical protein